MQLPDFRLETHFSKWEFRAEHHMTASDAEALSMPRLRTPSLDTGLEALTAHLDRTID